jgi:hypothetical protein
VPIFPELRPYFEAARDHAKRAAEYVITIRSVERSRQTGKPANLGTRMAKIIKRAGLTPWAKLFQNLRASRQTELTQQGFAEHVACEWLGNSQAVAREHYLRVTENGFGKAAGAVSGRNEEPKSEPLGNQKWNQNGNQNGNLHKAATSGTLGNVVQKCLEEKGLGHVYPAISDLLQNYSMTPTGLEPVLPP